MRKFFAVLFIIPAIISGTTVYAFSDVSNSSPSFKAIDYLAKNNILQGFSDQTFKPNLSITRAEFIKIAIAAKAIVQETGVAKSKPKSPSTTSNEVEIHAETNNLTSSASNCFTDVKKADWHSKYICYAKNKKLIEGYKDGSFKPNQPINIAEASKILVKIFNLKTANSTKYWYSPYLESLAKDKFLPLSINYMNRNLKRGEVAELIWRIVQKIHTETSQTSSNLENAYCQELVENLPSNINMQKVRETWLSWNNEVRDSEGLKAYTENDQLERTAIIWSENAKERGYIDHKRPGQTAYYDYKIIGNWFKNLGLEFKNIDGKTYTENIAWNVYKCSPSEADCTEQLIKAIRTGFDFFMSEKGKTYRPHYESIVNKGFKEIGLGIAIDTSKKKFYLTVHYGTEITSNPLPICK